MGSEDERLKCDHDAGLFPWLASVNGEGEASRTCHLAATCSHLAGNPCGEYAIAFSDDNGTKEEICSTDHTVITNHFPKISYNIYIFDVGAQ